MNTTYRHLIRAVLIGVILNFSAGLVFIAAAQPPNGPTAVGSQKKPPAKVKEDSYPTKPQQEVLTLSK